MGLNVFANCTPIRAIQVGSINAENLAVSTGAHISVRTAWRTHDKISDLKSSEEDLERQVWEAQFLRVGH